MAEIKIDHEFKSHPNVFWPAARGEKTFEFRKDDRGGYHVGQTVRLRCYDRGEYVETPPLDRRITNILRPGEFGLQDGYCILSLAPQPGSSVGGDVQGPAPFQQRVDPWLIACFGEEVARDKQERAHRFLEEALELVQAAGCTAHEAHQLVAYVYGRPAGEMAQEVGGVMTTLAAFCLAHGLDMHEAGETELARIWTKVEKIRAKQAAKPKHSPLPEHVAPTPSGDLIQVAREAHVAELIASVTDLLNNSLEHPIGDEYATHPDDNDKRPGDSLGKRLYRSRWMLRYRVRNAFRALQSTRQEEGRRAAAPEGWVLVPQDPTGEMLDAAVKGSRADVSYADVEELWPAMLSASPRHSQEKA
ncbi:hypothetical protein DK419_13485 [Methylobacterium terrae]|uniref:DUF3850 domain-containing protein n=1 Tax=Methylobacterium terrae TaxID=2202827 RepID=A0A2U8WLS7_9HYPH|nr:DUF3850 domain-containing protein [Methylobacterium terrae]AWN47205.1 hypothetical protein DK419_13485 [Methylobacterium terrae]